MSYLHSWLQFIKERFNPVSYSVMIFVFIGAHYVLYLNFIKQDISSNLSGVLYLIPLALAIFMFFFKLRLFDEVKDIESDAIHHPGRPLPRGILGKNDILRVSFILIILGIALFSFYGLWALASAMIAVIYSLVMYKEFFVKRWLRSHLTTYAVTHTFIVVLISVTIFVALFGKPFTKIPSNLIYFSFAGWFLFNIFEFGRKTFAQQEEKEGVDSYSKIFGRIGAVMLVLVMATLSIIFIEKITASPVISMVLSLWLGLTGIIGLLYAIMDRPYLAKIYRVTTSLYIILTYGTVVLLQFIAI